MPKMAIRFVDEVSGRMFNLSGGTVAPLNFDDLVRVIDRLDKPISFPLILTDCNVENSELEELNNQTIKTVSTTLNSPHGSTTIALVKGGWFPSGLAASDGILLPDRCTVAAIRSRFLGGVRKNGPHDDFLDFLATHSIRVNPMLYALEGTSGSASPDEAELSSLFDRAARSIQEALPQAVIFPNKADVIQGTLGLLRDTADSLRRKQKFLMKAAPLLAPSISNAARPAVFRALFALASECGIQPASMLVVAVLSAASASQNLNPAKKLLKPMKHYTKKNAYNALCDLRALDLLIAASVDFPEEPMILLTNDRALALVWTGLQAHDFSREGSIVHYRLDPHKAMFCNLSEADLARMHAVLTSTAF